MLSGRLQGVLHENFRLRKGCGFHREKRRNCLKRFKFGGVIGGALAAENALLVAFRDKTASGAVVMWGE
ncbi:MAG TPA: hypothetical protein DCR20_06695 [Planctomycetaceae bacterium]|nr:hypothetical protein [Planctomycetaceae bacterium]